MMKKICTLLTAAILVLSLAACGGSNGTTTTSSESGKQESAADAAGSSNSAGGSAEAGSTESAGGSAEAGESAAPAEQQPLRHAEIEIKDYGTVKLELDPNEAPLTVANFVKLAQEGFYDGLTFHRIMDGFMIQGGDPNGNGTGGASENIPGEFAANGVPNAISHRKGVISMARAQDPDSASSQFFIMVEDGDFLDGQYAAFGWVTEGQDIVDRIAAEAEPIDNNGTIPAEQQPVITKITIID
jgi:peptidyl-prolyl cis-trans isomerase B (cyclophilin B)